MESDDVEETFFFQSLLVRHPRLVEAAATTPGVVLLIPQSISLSWETIPAEIFEHHWLRPVRDELGEYETWSGRRVSVEGSQVWTGAGFGEAVRARILSTRAARVAEGAAATTTLHYVSRPLEGGVDAPASVSEMTEWHMETMAAVLSLAPGTDGVFESLDSVASGVEKLSRAADGRGVDRAGVKEVARVCRKACDRAAQALVSVPGVLSGGAPLLMLPEGGCGGCGGRRDGWQPLRSAPASSASPAVAWASRDRMRLLLTQVCESHLGHRVLDATLPALRRAKARRTERLALALWRLRDRPQADFSIHEAFRGPYRQARSAVRSLVASRTPLAKMLALRGALRLVNQEANELARAWAAAEDAAPAGAVGSAKRRRVPDLATDDVVDIVAWILVQEQGANVRLAALRAWDRAWDRDRDPLHPRLAEPAPAYPSPPPARHDAPPLPAPPLEVLFSLPFPPVPQRSLVQIWCDALGVGDGAAAALADPVAAAAASVTRGVSHRDSEHAYAHAVRAVRALTATAAPGASAAAGAAPSITTMLIRPEGRARIALGAGGAEELHVHLLFARLFHCVEDDESAGELDFAAGTFLQAARALLRAAGATSPEDDADSDDDDEHDDDCGA